MHYAPCLACLYRSLVSCSRGRSSSMGGYWRAWEVWACEYLKTTCNITWNILELIGTPGGPMNPTCRKPSKIARRQPVNESYLRDQLVQPGFWESESQCKV
ncbi:hypothetical protein L3X38_017791 [Prunus dulcis]|uniref:Uncharacterized protein n=1 Tax=Prunus dulcis TaxID=3755 RepID=A0AAD4W7T2_PRUDU|nr:hypothetical protein L3X38_017791 [Prunus dulcis]